MSICIAKPLPIVSEEEFELDHLIEQAYFYGCSHHGRLDLDMSVFAAQLMRVVEKHIGSNFSPTEAINFIAGLHMKDFYLAAACAQHSETAWQVFILTYRKYINDMASFISSSTYQAYDLADSVLVDMFLPDRFGQSRIASYGGLSSLATWLRVIVSNRAINERERKCNTMERLESASHVIDSMSMQKIEASLRASRYDKAINGSFKRACQRLTENERLMLLLRYESEHRLSEIAEMADVHTSTIARRLEQIRRKLRAEVISHFTYNYSLDHAAIEECIIDIIENPAHSILSFIKQQELPSPNY